ncbi:MAG: AAA family ATPase [Bacteroidales bacterium]|nr:AAA family ATPase [Bacteroidales bacterium]
MLLRVIIKNFLSFNGLEQFDLFPNHKRVTHSHHIYQRNPNPDVLKMSVIYGANGAGKSNLIKAVSFVKRFVSSDTFLNADSIKNWKFCLKPQKAGEPLFLAIEYETEERDVFLYSVEVNDNGIQKEVLKTSGTNNPGTEIFMRTASEVTLRGDITKEMMDIINNWVIEHPFASLFTINSNVQLLNNAAVTSSQKWFGEKLKVVGLNSFHPDIITRLKQHPKQLRFATDMFAEIGLGLNGIEVKTESFDKWLAANPQEDKILPRAEKMPDDVVLSKIVDNRNVSAISLEKGIRKVSELVFKQAGVEGYSTDMNIMSQSDGTVRLLILAPYLYSAVHEGATIVVDELDNSIHPHLVRGLVRYFADKDTNGQLIFSTHETCILDQAFLRPDEVWFVEKSNGESHPYSLNDFKIHNTISIENGYMAGRFGAIPFIGTLNF